jgi:hypothetical protein
MAEYSSAGADVPLFKGLTDYLSRQLRGLDSNTVKPKPIRKILLSTNGIGAIKAIRSIRRWAYDMFCNERVVSAQRPL